MASPTTSVLDDFNRANGTLGANWTTQGGAAAPAIVSNQLSSGTNTYASAIWTSGATFADPQEVFVTLVTKPSGNLTNGLWVGVFRSAGSMSDSVNYDGYEFDCLTGSGTTSRFSLWRVSDGAYTQVVANTDSTFNAGDAIMLTAAGGVVSGYRRLSGAWDSTPIVTYTDGTPLTGAGRLYTGITDTASGAGRLDDFGGGTTTGGGGGSTIVSPLQAIGPSYAAHRAASI